MVRVRRIATIAAMPSRGPEEVPMTMRSALVATFNSAFKLSDSGGGFAYDGHAYASMKPDTATIVGYRMAAST